MDSSCRGLLVNKLNEDKLYTWLRVGAIWIRVKSLKLLCASTIENEVIRGVISISSLSLQLDAFLERGRGWELSIHHKF
jgi:hypothetical protein